MSIDAVLSRVQEELPECLAVGYVDTRSGMLLGVRSVDSHPHQVLDLLAAATGELFDGVNLIGMDALFREPQPCPENHAHSFNEIIVSSENVLHAFLRSRQCPHHALVVVCRATTDVTTVLSRARRAWPAGGAVEALRAP